MNKVKIIAKKHSDQEVVDFLKKWQSEIEKYFPHFDDDDLTMSEISILNAEQENIGVFIVEYKGDELHVIVDFVIPNFRNKGIGLDLFEDKKEEFITLGFKKIISLTDNGDHREYLKFIGFVQSPMHEDRFELDL